MKELNTQKKYEINKNRISKFNILNTETKKSGFVYKTASKSAQDIPSKLQLIVSELEKDYGASNVVAVSSHSEADEILKYKKLLDAGAITKEEYDLKKKELLGL